MSRPTKSRRRRQRTRTRLARQHLRFVEDLERRYGEDMPYQEAVARQRALHARHAQIVDAYLAGHITKREGISAVEATSGARIPR